MRKDFRTPAEEIRVVLVYCALPFRRSFYFSYFVFGNKAGIRFYYYYLKGGNGYAQGRD